MLHRTLGLAPGLLLLVACADLLDARAGTEPLTSAAGVVHDLDFESFVYVPAGADTATVQTAIRRQVKSSLGALRELGIGIEDRDAQHNLDPSGWRRDSLAVVEADGSGAGSIDRVTYHYHDTALVERDRLPIGPVTLTMLFGDYVARAAELTPLCADDPTTEPDSLWYHFAPSRWSCREAIEDERAAVAAATEALAAGGHIARRDLDRRFVTVHAALARQADAPETYPEYDRLYGFRDDPSRSLVVVYAFFGVDREQSDPADSGLVEYLRFQRELRDRFPTMRVTSTAPHAWLLDFWIDGVKLEGVTFDDVERWIVDGTGYPAAVGADAGRRAALRAQVVERFAARWIHWQLPVTISDGTTTRDMTVELRTYYGWEDGTPERRQQARWRYLEAFWHADVFAYTGHSHFGHGPLEPFDYGSGNFPWRYQVMLMNSCLSFNYYDEDFLLMHPEGSRNLDMVVNGLPAYWRGMGTASARFVISLLKAEDSWREVLSGMQVDLPWEQGYDPMRAVNGELDNEYRAAERPLTVIPR